MLKLTKEQNSCPDHGTAWVSESGKGLACFHDDHYNADLQQKPERNLVRVKSKVERLSWEQLEKFFTSESANKDMNSAKLALGTLAVLQKENQFEKNIKKLQEK